MEGNQLLLTVQPEAQGQYRPRGERGRGQTPGNRCGSAGCSVATPARPCPLPHQQPQAPQPKPLIQHKSKPEGDDKRDPQPLINKVEIKGAKVIALERLEAPFKPLLGHTIRFQQLQKVINEASNIYRE